MNITVYTVAGFLEDEYHLVRQLFDKGLERLHLYKPGFSSSDIYAWLEALGANYWPKVVLHVYEGWVTATVGGYHLSRAYLHQHTLGDAVQHLLPGQTLSVSAHTPQDWLAWKDMVHAVVISPVFESISKPGVLPGDGIATWKDSFSEYPGKAEKIALGGVQPANIAPLKAAGFDTAAVSGWLWQDARNVIDRFVELQNKA